MLESAELDGPFNDSVKLAGVPAGGKKQNMRILESVAPHF